MIIIYLKVEVRENYQEKGADKEIGSNFIASGKYSHYKMALLCVASPFYVIKRRAWG